MDSLALLQERWMLLLRSRRPLNQRRVINCPSEEAT